MHGGLDVGKMIEVRTWNKIGARNRLRSRHNTGIGHGFDSSRGKIGEGFAGADWDCQTPPRAVAGRLFHGKEEEISAGDQVGTQ